MTRRPDLLLAELLQLPLDAGDERLDLLGGDRPLLAGGRDALDDLRAVERLAAAVLLHDLREDLLDPLVGGEAARAAEALAPAARRLPVLRLAGVDDPVLEVSAVRAAHVRGASPLPPRAEGEGVRCRSSYIGNCSQRSFTSPRTFASTALVGRRVEDAADERARRCVISRAPMPRVVSAGRADADAGGGHRLLGIPRDHVLVHGDARPSRAPPRRSCR